MAICWTPVTVITWKILSKVITRLVRQRVLTSIGQPLSTCTFRFVSASLNIINF